jgi:Co/Zn/Cd efflux system component
VANAAAMGLFGTFVFGQLAYKLVLQPPTFETMGAVGALALTANGVCLAML